MNLAGQGALVTGGGTGVGRETTLQLARLGANVVVNYSRSAAEAEQTAREAAELGVKASTFQADVADDAQCRAMVAETVRRLGRLDLLVNCAGTTTFIAHGDLERVTDADWDRILSVNLKGPFYCARAAAQPMRSGGGGVIINVSSIAGIAGIGSSIPYAASKAALNNLTITLAKALAPEIRVNAVAPGFITGRWLQNGLGPAYEMVKENIAQKTPLGKVSDPADVAAAIVSLITGSRMVTGQVLVVDGGMLNAH